MLEVEVRREKKPGRDKDRESITENWYSLVSLKFIVVMSGFRFRHGESLQRRDRLADDAAGWLAGLLVSGVYNERDDKKLSYVSGEGREREKLFMFGGIA